MDRQVKEEFVKWCLLMASNYNNSSRKWCELLALLVEFEPLQDIYRMNYELLAQVYGGIFSSYECYLDNLAASSEKQFLNTHESEFLASTLNNLKKTIKRCGDVKQFESAFTSSSQNSLVEVLLVMRGFKVDFFEELLEIDRLLCIELTDNDLITRIMKMPLHVRLLAQECAIVNRKGINKFLDLLLSHVFLPKASTYIDPLLSVTVAAYTIEMLGRHSINLSFEMNGVTVLQFLGKKIFRAVNEWKDTNLKDVLMLLCAALRLNPLILEENVFEITASMMMATKSGDIIERQLFEEYLVLLMDMFRRLSRAEKFVANLLKKLKENVNDSLPSKKRKHKTDSEDAPPNKKVGDGGLQKTRKATDAKLKYLNVLFQDFFKPVLSQNKSCVNSTLSASASFPKLCDIWPSNPVGVAFSKIITGLVSKPSLVICKTLLFALKELIESFENENELSEKSIFLLDFHTALLSQYFTGCKLAEQSEKFLEELAIQRQFILDVLQAFGKCLLGREHNPRTMTAFLEISYYATCFKLMLIYYRPDGCNHDTLMPTNASKKLHSFLTPDEWSLIHQRVLNFGKSSCKYLLQRLELQKTQSTLLLLGSHQDKSSLQTPFATADKETINSLLKDINAKWLLSQLTKNEKASVAAHIVQNSDLISLVLDDLELLEFVTLAIYEFISTTVVSKHSVLKALSCDYDKIRHSTETFDCEILIKQLVEVISARAEDECKVKKLNTNEIKSYLNLLSQIPMGHLRRQRKTIVFALHISLYRDLKSAQEEELAAQALDIMKGKLKRRGNKHHFRFF